MDAFIKEALENSPYSKDQLMHYDKYWDCILSERSAYMYAEEKGREVG